MGPVSGSLLLGSLAASFHLMVNLKPPNPKANRRPRVQIDPKDVEKILHAMDCQIYYRDGLKGGPQVP